MGFARKDCGGPSRILRKGRNRWETYTVSLMPLKLVFHRGRANKVLVQVLGLSYMKTVQTFWKWSQIQISSATKAALLLLYSMGNARHCG